MDAKHLTPEQRAACYSQPPHDFSIPFRYTCEQHLAPFDGPAVSVPQSIGVDLDLNIVCEDCAAALGDDGSWGRLKND